uniref:holo-[acyl-carrier-protein] synthase n=1 Tax=Opuntia streptacantha TaxID=393608 RepID=A0A7C9AL35_OPUST
MQFASGDMLPPLHFNLSHTSSMVACGITAHSPVGIDVEEKKRIIKHDVMSFARRFFSPHEVEHLASISDPEKRQQELIKLWTLKESYVKALGRGFAACPFKTFSISSKASSISVSDVPYIAGSKVPEIVESTNISHKWQFALLEFADTHYAAICMEKDTGFEVLVCRT